MNEDRGPSSWTAAAVREARSVYLSVVIPVSSEIGDLKEIYRRFSEQMEKNGHRYEFIFVANGVNRMTFEILEELREEHSDVRIIQFNRVFGEAISLSAGFEHARGDVIVTLASFMQTHPEDLAGLLREIETGADMVIGWRHPRVDPLLNRWQSGVFNWITRRLTKFPLHDLNCSLRVMRRKVVSAIPIYGDQFRFLPILAHRQGFRVKELQVRHVEEKGTTGFYGLGSYVRRLMDILTLFFSGQVHQKTAALFRADRLHPAGIRADHQSLPDRGASAGPCHRGSPSAAVGRPVDGFGHSGGLHRIGGRDHHLRPCQKDQGISH